MKKIITFIIVTFILSAVGYWLEINAKTVGISPLLAVFILMWCPGLAGIICSIVYDKRLSGLGFRPGALRWWGLAYLLPVLYGAAAYGIIWLAGFGSIDPSYHFKAFNVIVFGTIFNIAFAAGEEIGWRGFLVPQLYKHMGFTATCLVSGLIWSVWHFPEIIAGKYLAVMPLGPQLILLVISVTAMGFGINWLRLRSGSVWPAILFHASHNLYIQWVFDPMTKGTGPVSKYMTGESGIVLTIIFICLALVFWRLGKRLDEKRSPGATA